MRSWGCRPKRLQYVRHVQVAFRSGTDYSLAPRAMVLPKVASTPCRARDYRGGRATSKFQQAQTHQWPAPFTKKEGLELQPASLTRASGEKWTNGPRLATRAKTIVRNAHCLSLLPFPLLRLCRSGRPSGLASSHCKLPDRLAFFFSILKQSPASDAPSTICAVFFFLLLFFPFVYALYLPPVFFFFT